MDVMLDDSAELGLVPDLFIQIGWPYVGRCQDDVLISPTGIRTSARSRSDMPRPKDRLPFLYLCNLASEGAEAHFHAHSMAQWLGMNWRPHTVLERLHRILDCEIEVPTKIGWRRLHITEASESWHLDWDTKEARLVFSREFRNLVRSAAYYSMEAARQLTGTLATLDMYLKIMLIISRGVYQERWKIYEELPRARRRAKVMSNIRARVARLAEVCPDHPFRWMQGELAICCSQDDFDTLVYNRNEPAETQRIDGVIDSRSREELHAYLDRVSPDMARRIKKRFVERLWPDNDNAQTAPDTDVLPTTSSVRNQSLRELIGPSRRDNQPQRMAPVRDESSKPTAVVTPKQPHETSAPDTAIEADAKPSQTASQPNDAKPRTRKAHPVDVSERGPDAHVAEPDARDKPREPDKTRPRGLFHRMRARIPKLGTDAHAKLRKRDPPREPDKPESPGLLSRVRTRLRTVENRAKDLAVQLASKTVRATASRAPPQD